MLRTVASSVSPLSLHSHEQSPRDQISRFWCGSSEVDVQFVRGSDVFSNIEGFARVYEVAARGSACKLLKNERGIEAEGWWWELLDKTRIPGGHDRISHVWTVPRVMQICSRARVSLTNIAKLPVVTTGIKTLKRLSRASRKKKISFPTQLVLDSRQWTNIYVQLIDARRPVIGQIEDDEATIL